VAALDITPTRAGFLLFIRNVMGVSTTLLPDNSTSIDLALALALDIANTDINLISPSQYTWAVYNLGGSNLLTYAQDVVNTPVQGSDPPTPYFAWARKQFNINGFVSGVIQSAGDEGTNSSMVVQEAAKNFTLGNLQNLKDPYGRAYLAIAQDMGDLWGMT